MNEIAIRIFWGPYGGEFNASPVVSMGKVIGSIAPSTPSLVGEDAVWMLKIDNWKSVFSCFSKERGANGEIQLLVCVVIPKGQILADNKSPLDLLEDVGERFARLFAYDLQAEQPAEEKVQSEFDTLLKGYSLIDCPWYVFSMEGDQPASFCVEGRPQLDALMRFNAYPALAHIEHLELGFYCSSTVIINTKGSTDNDKKPEKKRRWWGRSSEKKPEPPKPVPPKPVPPKPEPPKPEPPKPEPPKPEPPKPEPPQPELPKPEPPKPEPPKPEPPQPELPKPEPPQPVPPKPESPKPEPERIPEPVVMPVEEQLIVVTPLDEEPETDLPLAGTFQMEEAPRRSKKMPWYLIVLIVVGGIIMMFLLFFFFSLFLYVLEESELLYDIIDILEDL